MYKLRHKPGLNTEYSCSLFYAFGTKTETYELLPVHSSRHFLVQSQQWKKTKKSRTMCEICSHQWSRSGVFIVNFKQIWHIFTFFWLIIDLEQVNVDWHQLRKKCPYSESFWRHCILCIFENHGRRTEWQWHHLFTVIFDKFLLLYCQMKYIKK